MKVKTLSILAGAGSLLIAGSASAAILTVNVDVTHSGWLELNGLQSANVTVTFHEDVQLIGLGGANPPAGTPWHIATSDASGFFNWTNAVIPANQVTVSSSSQIANSQLFLGEGDEATWNTGLGEFLHGQLTSAIAVDNPQPFSFARHDQGGANATSNAFTWGNFPSGIFISANTTLQIMQLTFGALETADISWEFLIDPFPGQDATAPELSFSAHIPAAIPAPGVLALLGLAGLVGVRRRRA